MIIAQVFLRLATIKGLSKMCSFITQHNATDVAELHAPLKNVDEYWICFFASGMN